MALIQSPGVTKSTATMRPVSTGTAMRIAVSRMRTYLRRLYGSSPIMDGKKMLAATSVVTPAADTANKMPVLRISCFIIPSL